MSAYRKWECQICNWIYDEEKGYPEEGIAPGTRWEDIPDDWSCPECGVGKEDFDMEVVAVATAEIAPNSHIAKYSIAKDNISDAPIVIVGSGFAGYQLVKEIRKLDTNIPISMYTHDDGAYYSKPKLSNSISQGLKGHQLVISTAEELAIKYDITIHPFSHVTSIDSGDNSITLEDGSRRPFSKLVLATGAKCKTVPVAGNAVGEVIQVNSLFDYIKFRTLLANKKRVLIMGAGLIGCEFADDLSSKGYHVTVVDPASTLLSSLIPAQASEQLKEKLVEKGLDCITERHVRELNYGHTGIMVKLNDGASLEADIVLSAVGIEPNTSIAQSSRLACGIGIQVDSQLQTSRMDVFALGDCAEVNGSYMPYIAPIMHQTTALAKTLVSAASPVKYSVMPIVIKTKSLPINCVPKPRGAEGKWFFDENDETGIVARFINENRVTLGYVLTGTKVNKSKQFINYMLREEQN